MSVEHRCAIHAQMVKRPKDAVTAVFGVTTASHSHLIQHAFEQCAAQTGCTANLMKKVQEFRTAGVVPDFVLQYCSAKATADGIEF